MTDRKADRHLSRRNHTHFMTVCAMCAEPLDCYCLTGGRQRVYCTDACQQRAYRIRRELAEQLVRR
jgi:hypothetical protein